MKLFKRILWGLLIAAGVLLFLFFGAVGLAVDPLKGDHHRDQRPAGLCNCILDEDT